MARTKQNPWTVSKMSRSQTAPPRLGQKSAPTGEADACNHASSSSSPVGETAPPRLGQKSAPPLPTGGADACNYASSASSPATDSVEDAGCAREVPVHMCFKFFSSA
jgi:hypothetical protein